MQPCLSARGKRTVRRKGKNYNLTSAVRRVQMICSTDLVLGDDAANTFLIVE